MISCSEDLTYSDTDTQISLRYRAFVPDASNEKVPLVVFLHGAGQRGDDNIAQLSEGDVGHIAKYASSFRKAVVVAPQCPKTTEWADSQMLQVLDSFMNMCITNAAFNVDSSKVYLAGFSMGGIGTWKVLLRGNVKVAAAIPVCGGPLIGKDDHPGKVPESMKKISIWAFNNCNDDVVQNMFSKNIMSALWSGKQTAARYTELNEGHSDEYVFQSIKVMDWLFSQSCTED